MYNYCNVYSCYTILMHPSADDLSRDVGIGHMYFTIQPRNWAFEMGEHFSDHCRHITRYDGYGRRPKSAGSRPRNQAYWSGEHSPDCCRLLPGTTILTPPPCSSPIFVLILTRQSKTRPRNQMFGVGKHFPDRHLHFTPHDRDSF